MRIVRRVLLGLAGLVVALLLASVLFNAVTSDANVPVTRLWHGPFEHGTAYRRFGSAGTPIVLLGGFLEPSFVWDRVAPLLARTHRVYALDLDGFGYSVRRGPWTLAGWADQVQEFIRALHLGHPLVVGHSLGAAVALELARRHVASRVVLLDGDGLAVGGPPHWVRELIARSPFFTTAFRIGTRWDWLVRRVLRNAYAPGRPPPGNAAVDRWTRQFRAEGARSALQGLLEGGIAGLTQTELASLRVRARVVWGAEDDVDPVSAGRRTAAALHAPFVLVPGAGHLALLTAPGLVARAMLGLR